MKRCWKKPRQILIQDRKLHLKETYKWMRGPWCTDSLTAALWFKRVSNFCRCQVALPFSQTQTQCFVFVTWLQPSVINQPGELINWRSLLIGSDDFLNLSAPLHCFRWRHRGTWFQPPPGCRLGCDIRAKRCIPSALIISQNPPKIKN